MHHAKYKNLPTVDCSALLLMVNILIVLLFLHYEMNTSINNAFVHLSIFIFLLVFLLCSYLTDGDVISISSALSIIITSLINQR